MMSAAASSSANNFSNVPPRTADFTETWAFLRPGVDHIMTNLYGLSFPDFTNLYTAVYNYFTTGIVAGNHAPRRANPLGFDLYQKLTEYFTIHFVPMKQAAASLQDEELLRYYATEWTRYTTGAKNLNRLFVYLNRSFVKQERAEGKWDIHQVYTLALAHWKSHFFVHIQKDNSKLTGAVLRLIERQRNGDSVDQGLVKEVVLSFVSLDPFIQASELYYKTESEVFLAENTVSEYLKKAEEWLREEEDRVERYLHTKTRKELIAKCEDVLIRQHAQLQDSFQKLFEDGQDEDLQRVCALLARIPDGLEPFRKRFEGDVTQAGLSAVSKIAGEGAVIDSLDLKVYVDALLEVHHENSETVMRRFNSNALFAASLDNACREFVNRNGVTGSSSTKSAELISKHADMLLRKTNKMAEEDLELALDRIMTLFKYLEDKDVFQTFYTTQLTKRLIHSVSVSDEAEASMISKLEEACGFEYVYKLQRMFTNVGLSKDLTDAFKQSTEQNHGDIEIDFSIMVLGTNFWSLNPPNHDFAIPVEIISTYERFQKYYQSKHSGRKLTWLWNYSKNELRANYLNQKYILMTSAYQTSVLLQYNRHDTLSMDKLVAATSISQDILSRVLALLVKAKILINDEEDQYDLNPGFKSKKIRVNLNQPLKAEVKAESSDILTSVDEDRKYVIQATIVRIMKTRQTMTNQALIQQVVSQISQRFAPKIPVIKKAIETLLEKEYMERVDGQKDTFAYVA
ncbi:Cullin-domain-containing protein [Hymenopellis radicata]|nr:Cullin-domain-containing protein [Hymenopellis radicata]